MKKSLITLLVLSLLFGAFLMSCSSDVDSPAAYSTELVDVTFDEGSNSKSLTATLETFNKGDYYWKYAAKKNVNDTSGLTSGATTTYDEDGAVFIHEATSGLTGKVSGFSQGVWDFKLFAFERTGAGTATDQYVYTHKYTGEVTGVSLKKGSNNTVTVTVSPYTEGTGTLFIDSTPLTPKTSTNVPSVSRYLKVQTVGSKEEKLPTSGTTYTLDAGAYLVTVTYKSNDVVFAEGTVIATIYPNLTTTVAGSIDELITYAQFDAVQNPDIITKTAGVDGITSTTTGDSSGNIKLTEASTVEDKKVEATVPAAAAKALLPQVGGNPDPNASMSLALNVDTVDSTSTSVTYEISMTKVVTLNSEVSTSDVTTLGTYTEGTETKKYYAVATVQLSAGLTGVAVTHSGNAMVNSTSTTDDNGNGVYSYDATTGILTIQTNTFSPFAVTYDGLSFGVAELKGVKYSTLKAAVEAAEAGDTVKLLCDTEGSGMSINKSITIDLNGKTYTGTKDPAGSAGTKTQLFQLLQNNTVTIKNGKLASTPDSGIKRLIQNYSNLTLTDVIVDGSNIGEGQYTVSNNSGETTINGATSIIAPSNGVAFDVCSGWGGYKSCIVNLNTTGTINGNIEVADYKLNTEGVYLNIDAAVLIGDIVVPEWTDKIHVNKVYYNTNTHDWFNDFKTAISDAVNGDTIEVYKDTQVTEIIGITKSLTIEGNNHKLFIPSDALNTVTRVFNFDGNTKDIDFTLNNVTVDARTAKRERAISFYGNTGKVVLNINHSKISSDYYAINVAGNNANITVNMDDSSCSTGWCAIQTWSANSVFNISNSELSGVNDKTYNADHWNDFSTIVFNEDAEGAKATFTNCKIFASQTTGNIQTLVSFRANDLVNVYENCRFYVDGEEITENLETVVDNWNFTSWDAIYTASLTINGTTILEPVSIQ